MSPSPDAEPSTAREIRSLSFVFAMLYFVQGIAEPSDGLIAQPVRSVLRDRGHGDARIGWFVALIGLPWAFKPIYGLLTDFVPFLGMRRRSWLLASTSLMTIGLLSAAAAWNHAQAYRTLAFLLLIPATAIAFSDVVIDAVMIEHGQRLQRTGRFQSVQWSAMSAATLLAGVLGGYVSQHDVERWALAGCGLIAAAGFLTTWFALPEPAGSPAQAHSHGWKDALTDLSAAIRDPAILFVAAFLAMWTFNPFAAAVLQSHMVHHWGWSELFYGETVSWMAAGLLMGSILYGRLAGFLTAAWLFHLAIGAGVVSNLLYALISTPASARIVTLVSGVVYMFGNLASLDLTARVCRPESAGTVFASLMAVSNLSLSASTAVGGYCYEMWKQEAGAQIAYHRLVGMGAAATACCWLLTPVLHRALRTRSDAGANALSPRALPDAGGDGTEPPSRDR